MGYCDIYMLVLPRNQVQTKKLIAICSGLQLTKVLNKIVEATDSFFFWQWYSKQGGETPRKAKMLMQETVQSVDNFESYIVQHVNRNSDNVAYYYAAQVYWC